MQLHPHVAQVQDQLAAAAALGDERTREIADTLATAPAPAVRLAVLDALSAAADEVTATLLDYPGAPAVTIRLDGDELTVDVAATAATDDEPARPDDGDANARISLRLSEGLKADIDSAAERDGISVNTWLVRAAAQRCAPGRSGPAALRRPGRPAAATDAAGGATHHHITGWING